MPSGPVSGTLSRIAGSEVLVVPEKTPPPPAEVARAKAILEKFKDRTRPVSKGLVLLAYVADHRADLCFMRALSSRDENIAKFAARSLKKRLDRDAFVDTLFRFHNATVFFGFTGDAQRRQMEQFMLAFDSNLAPIVGQQTTLTATNGATRVVPGSHPVPNPLSKSRSQPESRHPNEKIVVAEAGSVLLFNSHLLHSGTRNVSGERRRVLQCSFAACYAPHPDETRPEIPQRLPAAARYILGEEVGGC